MPSRPQTRSAAKRQCSQGCAVMGLADLPAPWLQLLYAQLAKADLQSLASCSRPLLKDVLINRSFALEVNIALERSFLLQLASQQCTSVRLVLVGQDGGAARSPKGWLGGTRKRLGHLDNIKELTLQGVCMPSYTPAWLTQALPHLTTLALDNVTLRWRQAPAAPNSTLTHLSMQSPGRDNMATFTHIQRQLAALPSLSDLTITTPCGPAFLQHVIMTPQVTAQVTALHLPLLHPGTLPMSDTADPLLRSRASAGAFTSALNHCRPAFTAPACRLAHLDMPRCVVDDALLTALHAHAPTVCCVSCYSFELQNNYSLLPESPWKHVAVTLFDITNMSRLPLGALKSVGIWCEQYAGASVQQYAASIAMSDDQVKNEAVVAQVQRMGGLTWQGSTSAAAPAADQLMLSNQPPAQPTSQLKGCTMLDFTLALPLPAEPQLRMISQLLCGYTPTTTGTLLQFSELPELTDITMVQLSTLPPQATTAAPWAGHKWGLELPDSCCRPSSWPVFMPLLQQRYATVLCDYRVTRPEQREPPPSEEQLIQLVGLFPRPEVVMVKGLPEDFPAEWMAGLEQAAARIGAVDAGADDSMQRQGLRQQQQGGGGGMTAGAAGAGSAAEEEPGAGSAGTAAGPPSVLHSRVSVEVVRVVRVVDGEEVCSVKVHTTRG